MRFDEARELLAAFGEEDVRYVLVGSIGMAAHGITRATQDIDFFIAADDDNVERVKRALRRVFSDDAIDEISAADLRGPAPVIRYGPPDSDFTIDLVARLGDAFTFEDIESEEVSVEGVQVRVATPRMLYEMKKDTVRPQDRVDAERLREKFGLSDEES